MADFDWVKARAACSLEVLFQQLRVAVKRDVDSMNAVLAQAGRPVQCQFGDFSNRFLVMRAGRIRSEIDSTAATDAEVQALVEATA